MLFRKFDSEEEEGDEGVPGLRQDVVFLFLLKAGVDLNMFLGRWRGAGRERGR